MPNTRDREKRTKPIKKHREGYTGKRAHQEKIECTKRKMLQKKKLSKSLNRELPSSERLKNIRLRILEELEKREPEPKPKCPKKP